MATALVGAPLLSATAGASTVGLIGAGGVLAPTMGSIATSGLLTYVGTGMRALSALSSIQAGRQQAASYKFQSMQQDLANRQEKVRAKEAENEARRRFLSTLSSTQAAFGARGISTSVGTPQQALINISGESGRDIAALNSNTQMNLLQGQMQSQQYRTAGQQASTQGFQAGLGQMGNLFAREFVGKV